MQHEKTVQPGPAEKAQNDPVSSDTVNTRIATDNALQDSEITAAIAAADVAAGLRVYADNAAAVTAGLAIGTRYRTGDAVKIVHI